MTNCVHLPLELVLLIITSRYDFLFLGKMQVIIFIFNKPSTSKVVYFEKLGNLLTTTISSYQKWSDTYFSESEKN